MNVDKMLDISEIGDIGYIHSKMYYVDADSTFWSSATGTLREMPPTKSGAHKCNGVWGVPISIHRSHILNSPEYAKFVAKAANPKPSTKPVAETPKLNWIVDFGDTFEPMVDSDGKCWQVFHNMTEDEIRKESESLLQCTPTNSVTYYQLVTGKTVRNVVTTTVKWDD